MDSEAARPTPSECPGGTLWWEQVVCVKRGRRRLVGVMAQPAPPASGPPRALRGAALVLHGWGSYRSGPHRMLVELCRQLAAGGFAALRFDFSGRGDSGGDYWETDLDLMIADALAAADWLQKRTGNKELAAVGLCSGSNVALGAAAQEERFGAVCALSALPFQKQRGKAQAATRTRSTLHELFLKALRPETYRRLFRGEIAVGRILRRLLLGEGGKSARAKDGKRGRAPRNLKDSRRDIQAELANFKGRLLFVYGAADAEGLSGWRDVLEPFLSENGVQHRQLEIAGADHDYHGLAVKRQAIAAAMEFLTS